MTTTTKTPRLLEAAKEFNVGKDTLVAFLNDKGFSVSANPALKLTEQMYKAAQVHFAQDKAAKRKSDEIALPKGSGFDNLKKRDEVVPVAKKEEVVVPVVPPVKPVVPPVVTVEEKPKIAEEPKKVVEVVAKAPAPKTEVPENTEEHPAPKAKTTSKKAAGEADHKKTDPVTADASNQKEEAPEAEHLETKAPKIEGPNVLGKINLDELNLASRPKKGAKKKEEETAPVKKETKTTAKPKASKAVESAVPATEKTEPKPVPVTPTPAIAAESTGVAEDEAQVKPEHIEMKAPKLEGPKIIGRIELPVNQPSGNTRPDPRDRDRNGEKRKRKRIPVDKKGEPGQPAQPGFNRPQPGTRGSGVGGDRGPGYQGGANRPGGGQGGAFQRPGGFQGGGAGRTGDKKPFNRDNNRPGQRPPLVPGQQQEIDTKAIQDKIRETQAKLSGSTRSKNLKAKYRRNKRDEMAEKRMAAENAELTNVIQVTEFISVSELASLLNVSFADVISKCMSLGIMVSINQRLDAEVIELVASEFNYVVEFINLEQEEEEEEVIEDAEEDLLPRAPIVTIMGHVDHGKTSLLDYIRSANVVAGEAGGITQHIGAYQVTTAAGKKVTFLDTPGHEAFTAMRARGAKVADVAVIVVAADDAIMPQTREAISHAQAANLPMIFAINKIDKPGANPEKIKEQLAQLNILVEDWGGKFQCQEISAKKGTNIDTLLEKIALEAEILDLRANPDRIASGSVIEASLDKGRGYQSTILVQNGTLNQGDMIACGQNFGKIKAMFNERGQRVKTAGPSAPVQVLGLNGAPQAGEKFKVYENEDEAKDVANHRAQIMREQGIRARKHITLDEIGRRLALGNFKELGVIIKGDFDGSVEALSDSLQKLSTEEVSVNVVHKGVGQITESDVLLATASDAIILGFQVRPSMQASKLATQENIEIRTYSIIYDAIDEIKSAMEGLLEPKIEKKTVSNIEVREIYKISGLGTIAGCYVLDGKMTRQTKLNLVRDGIVVYTGELASLKRFKDDVKEVNAGYECGLSIKNYADVRVGDIIEGFEEVEVKRTL